MIDRLYILLGRAGDVLSFLPLLIHDAQSGQKPALMVAKEYATLLEGQSFVECVPFDGQMHEIDRAYSEAKKLTDNVRCVQTAGPPELVKKYCYEPSGHATAITDSHNKELWMTAGRFPEWKQQYPLIFDRRNKEREEALIAQVLTKKKPTILVSTSGISSPFPCHDLLLELLRLKFKNKYHIINIGQVRAERFYDLLGLYEHPIVHCLVASDSAPLHLAFACRVPVVALIQDAPNLWYGSAWRKNHVAHIRYKDFPLRAVEMLDAIEAIRKPASYFVCGEKGRKIVHVWNQYEINGQRERIVESRNNWDKERSGGRWINAPVEVGVFGQDSKSVLKDQHRFPLLKDSIALAAQRAGDDDVLCLTRADVQFESAATQEMLTAEGPLFARRIVRSPDGDSCHPYVDLFAFTKKWWQQHEAEFPAFVWGIDPFWNRTLMEFAKQRGAKECEGLVYRSPANPIVYDPMPLYASYNEKLYNEWIEKHGISKTAPAVYEQLPGVLVNRRALYPNGYNGSLIRYKGRLLMAYRWHANNGLETQLAIAEVDEDGNVLNNEPIEVPGLSSEDPRLFIHRDELRICYVDSKLSNPSDFRCVIKHGLLTQDKGRWKADGWQVKYGRNDWSGFEKNWPFWSHNDRLFCIYTSRPEQVVLEVEGDTVIAEHKSPGPRWKWGEIRGGTSPLPHDGKLLRFFHSRLDHEIPPHRSRYYIGAALMEPEPPFKTITVSRSPILQGSEVDEMSQTERYSCFHRKELVAFVMGAIAAPDGYLLSVGVNDSMVALVKVKAAKLNL